MDGCHVRLHKELQCCGSGAGLTCTELVQGTHTRSAVSSQTGALPFESLWWVTGSQGGSLVQRSVERLPQGLP